MFIADVFKHLKNRIEGASASVPELDEYFGFIFDAILPDLSSAYLVAAVSSLIKHLTIWDKLIIGLEDKRVRDLILSSNLVANYQTLPAKGFLLAVRLPVIDGRLIMEAQTIAPEQAFDVAPAPGAYLAYVLSDVSSAEIAVRAAAAQTDIRFPVAVMVNLSLSDCDRFIAVLDGLDYRVAGWLNILEPDGRTQVIALVMLGAGSDEI